MSDSLKRVAFFSNILMLLTTLHHIYGALIYHTPWRMHVIFVSLPVMAVTILFTKLIQKNKRYKNGFLFWLNWSIILLVSIGLIGCFEGIYNHFVKDLLFFAGTDRKILLGLFPPPKYELPNDVFFEITGVMQAVITVILMVHFVRLTGQVVKKTDKRMTDEKALSHSNNVL